MKKLARIFTFITLFCSLSPILFAQAPQGVNYQAVARDASGKLLTQANITVGFSIHKGSPAGTVVYIEKHGVTTNDYGLFSLVIGEGSSGADKFEDIDWNEGKYFLEVSIDGNSVSNMQLMSVPYALSVAPRKQYYSIPGAVFQTNNNESVFKTSIGQGGAEITTTGGNITNVLVAPVNLPHGARIQKFTAFFKDESAAQDFSVTLNRENLNSGVFDPIATINTSGDTSGWRKAEMAVANEIVDNISFGHFIRVFCSDWNATGAKAVKGVLIEYIY